MAHSAPPPSRTRKTARSQPASSQQHTDVLDARHRNVRRRPGPDHQQWLDRGTDRDARPIMPGARATPSSTPAHPGQRLDGRGRRQRLHGTVRLQRDGHQATRWISTWAPGLRFIAPGKVDGGRQHAGAGRSGGQRPANNVSSSTYTNFDNLTVNSGNWRLTDGPLVIPSGAVTLKGGVATVDNNGVFGTGVIDAQAAASPRPFSARPTTSCWARAA